MLDITLAESEVPLDVLGEADLDRVLGRVAEELLRLRDAQRPAERHQLVALDALELDAREVLLRDLDEVLDGARRTVGEVEDLVLRLGLLDREADAVDEVVDVREVEALLAV